MTISDLIQYLCLSRCTPEEQDKLRAIFLLESSILEITARAQDVMAALLRLTWHREHIITPQPSQHSPCEYQPLINKYHKSFEPLLDQYFTGWEIAIERRENLSADILMNQFIMPRAQIWKALSTNMQILMTIFYINIFIYNLPYFVTHKWQPFTKKTYTQELEQLQKIMLSLHKQCYVTHYNRFEKIVYYANQYLLNQFQKHKHRYDNFPVQINYGLMQLYIVVKTLTSAKRISITKG